MGKFEVPEHYVVVDTNALYAPEPAHIVAPGFDAKWADCRKLATLHLLVPDVVKQEIMFQQVFIAQKSRENAQKSLRTIADITATQIPTLKADPQLRSEVGAVFEKWRAAVDATIVATPLGKIKWRSLVQDATWRRPPFSLPSQAGDDSEKGFRDALILETLYEVWSQHPDDYVAFISNDALTQSVASEKKGKNVKRLVFPALSDLHSHLKLLNEEHGQKYVSALLAAVPAVFYRPNDATCVYNRFNVPARIQKDQEQVLNPMFDPEPAQGLAVPALSAILGKTSLKLWKALSEEKVFLGTTRFDSIDGAGRFIWKTQVDYVRLCVHEDIVPGQYSHLFQPTRRIRIAHFDVVWTSQVSADADVSDPQLRETAFVKKEYEAPTLEKCTRYNLLREMGYTEPQPQQPA